ncbi:MAG: hypothetical protein SNJ56_03080, partial [Termitinemataceae bacterium]
MFENILGQPAVDQLIADITSASLPPSILFEGPIAAGKGSTALELARVLSCISDGAPWNCACSECMQHRQLTHPDLLLLGSRNFISEISAASAAFLREPESAARLLFIRSVRKLLARFNPIIWEGDESKLAKLGLLITNCNEELEELSQPSAAEEKLEKVCASLVQHALQLESEGISETIPISQIRAATYWAHLAPLGKRKLLVIENADKMQDSSRNALLKLLEEPPATTQIVLCTPRKTSLLPTIRSRLRPYQFVQRSRDIEAQVLRRVFRDPVAAHGDDFTSLSSYLETFLPVPPESTRKAAVDFLIHLLSNIQPRNSVHQSVLSALSGVLQETLSGKDASQDQQYLASLSMRQFLQKIAKDLVGA